MRNKILMLFCVFLMMVSMVSAVPVFSDITVTPENPDVEDDVTICADVVGVPPPLLGDVTMDWDNNDGRTGDDWSMTNTEGDTYCITLSWATIAAEDEMDVDYNMTATDADDTTTTPPAIYTYDGEAPTADLTAGEPYTCDEGALETLNASLSTDTVDDTLEFTWDLDDDGIYETDTGETATVDFNCVDDTGGPFTVSVNVSDDTGYSAIVDSSVAVSNLDPAVTAPGDDTGEENSPVTIGDVTFTDDGTADTHTATIDWDDGAGAVDLGAVTSPISGLSNTYTEEGIYTVTITVTDDDGGEDFDTLDITIDNAPPVVTAPADDGGDEGEEIFIGDVTFTDASDGDTHTAEIDWGDGEVDDLGAVTSPISGLSHTYADDDTYIVTITVTDSELDDGEDTLDIVVDNVDPVVTAPADTEGVAGEEIEIDDVLFTDAGSDCPLCLPPTTEDFTATVDWGDGDVEDVDGGADVTSPMAGLSHSYDDDGVYTVTITVTDDDGGFHSDTLEITVYNNGIDLEEGWNLMSLPLVPEDDDTDIESVLADISDDVISVWSYQEGEWYYYDAEEGNGTLTTMVPGYGYFIEMDDDAILFVNGEKVYNFGENAQPPSVTLIPSWNLIGHYGTNEVARDDALETIEDGYATVLDEDGFSVTALNPFSPEEGYWLFLKGAEDMEYAPSEAAYEDPEEV